MLLPTISPGGAIGVTTSEQTTSSGESIKTFDLTGQDKGFFFKIPQNNGLVDKLYREYGEDSFCWLRGKVYDPATSVSAWRQINIENLEAERSSTKENVTSQSMLNTVYNKKRSIGTYICLVNAAEIAISHSHSWEDKDSMGMAILDKLIGWGHWGLAIANGITSDVRGGRIVRPKAYSESEPIEITVPLVLIATSDPLFDVVVPATILSALSYPSKIDYQIINTIKNKMQDIMDSIESALGSTDSDGTKSNLQVIYNFLRRSAAASIDTYSFVSWVAPCYWSISFSNQILDLERCAITAIETTYHGPWRAYANAMSHTSSKRSKRTLIRGAERIGTRYLEEINKYAGTAGRLGSKLIERALNQQDKRKRISVFDKENMVLAGYPLWAEVNVTFTSLVPMFRDDILKSVQSKESKVQIRQIERPKPVEVRSGTEPMPTDRGFDHYR